MERHVVSLGERPATRVFTQQQSYRRFPVSQVALVVLEKSYGGEIFTNTYAFVVEPDTALEPLSNAGVLAVVGSFDEPYTDARTDGSGTPIPVDEAPLVKAIAYDRLMTSPIVVYSRAYVSDGKTPSGEPSVFASIPLSFNGIDGPPSATTIAPLSIVLEINRVPAGPSARSGRIQMRAALINSEYGASPGTGVALFPAGRTAVTGRNTAAIDGSSIDTCFFSGGDTTKLGIPKFVSTGLNKGAISGFSLVSNLTVDEAKSRQVPKGRKRTP